MTKLALITLSFLFSLPVLADTPPQQINKLCSPHQFFSQIQPGPNNVNCTQPQYTDIGNVPTASASQTGVLSSSDWSLFNSKQQALTLGNLTSGTTGASFSGGTGAVVGSGAVLTIQTASGSQPGLLSASDWTAFNSKQSALTLGNLTSPTTGVSVSGGTGAVVGSGATVAIQTASTSQPGLLSAADWNTFNNKLGALTIGAFGSTPNASGLSYSAGALSGQPADATHPGMVSNATQTLGSGDKTINSLIAGQKLVYATSINTQNGAQVDLNAPTTPLIHIQGTAITGLRTINTTGVSDGFQLTLTNNTLGNFPIFNQLFGAGGASILTGTGSNIDLLIHTSKNFVYDATQNLWLVQNSTPPASGSTPGVLTQVSQVIGGNKTFQALTTFNQGATFLAPVVRFSTEGDASIGKNLGIQTTTPAYPLDVKSTVFFHPPTPDTPTVNLNTATPPSDVGSASATQISGTMDAPTSPSANPNYGGSGFTADGSSYTYTFWSYQFTPDQTFSVPFSTANFTDDGSSNPFSVDLNWGGPSVGSPNGYWICRSINGGSQNCQDVGSTTNFSDDNTLFTDVPPTVFFDDYVANGTTRNYQAYGQFSAAGGNYYSVNSYNYSMTDNNSNQSYHVQHGISTASGSFDTKITGARDGTSNNSSFEYSLGGIETPSSWVGDTTTSPTTYGFQANGSNLNRDFQFYPRILVNGQYGYTASPVTVSTTDPNDGNFYYFSFNGIGASGSTYDSMKILQNINGAGYSSAYVLGFGQTAFDYNAFTPSFSDSTTVTPNDIYPSTASIQSTASDSSGAAAIVCNESNDYCRFDFKDHTGTIQGSIVANGSGISIQTPAVVSIPQLVIPSGSPGSGSTCTAGMIARDISYFYVCVSANTWKRTALSTY